MMRKSKIITIDGVGEVTIKETSPYAVYHALSAKNKVEEFELLAAECITLPKGKELKKLYGSEIEQVVDAFVQVNDSFLTVPAKLGLKPMLQGMVGEISKTLPGLFADAFRQAIPMPGITAGQPL